VPWLPADGALPYALLKHTHIHTHTHTHSLSSSHVSHTNARSPPPQTGTFLRGVLDKVGVQPQVKRIGAYKSAGDQLLRKDMCARAPARLGPLGPL
jgi:hypothetical protein